MNSELDTDNDSSVYRKRYRDFSRAYENVFSKTESDQYQKDLIEKKRELEKLKKQIQTEKVEYNQQLRIEARDELLVEKIRDAVSELNERDPIEYFENSYNVNYEDGPRTWVLAFGDAHFGADLQIKGLHGEIINEYSPEIFYDRMNELMVRVCDIIIENEISELYVFDLGDAIDGILRVSQLMKLRYGVVQSTIKYADFLAYWLYELSKMCPIKFRMCNGNHSEIRHLGQKKGAFEQDNMGEVIYEFLKIRLGSDDIPVDISRNDTGMIFEEIQGFNILGYHGESKDLDAAMKDFRGIYKTDIDLLIAGHLHHSFSETVGVNSDIMRTPSIIGIDDFSMKCRKTSNPGATMFCVERDAGKTIEYHIKLGVENHVH